MATSARALASLKHRAHSERQAEPGEQRHHRKPPMVEQLTRDQPAEHAAGAVAVGQPGPLQELVRRGPFALVKEGHDHPRGGEQRSAEQQSGTTHPPHHGDTRHDRPDEQRRQGEVAGLEVEGDRQ